jgi:hypothetical protein
MFKTMTPIQVIREQAEELKSAAAQLLDRAALAEGRASEDRALAALKLASAEQFDIVAAILETEQPGTPTPMVNIDGGKLAGLTRGGEKAD